jgi:phosphoribosylanthranilate isomerase
MRDRDNIRALEKTAIDWMGFIFYPGSLRYIPDEDRMTETILSCSKVKAGVFVNATQEEIEKKAAKYRLDYVQLHGNESPEMCHRLKDAGYKIIKAFPISSASDFHTISAYETCVDYFLFDTKDTGYGGTGRRFNWSLLEAYRGDIPFLLSGGIGAEHLEELSLFRHPLPAGIDLNSRFEYAPAIKDIDKIERFIQQLKNKIK